MKADCIQIHTKRRTLDALYTIDEKGNFNIKLKPLHDLLLSYIFFDPKSRRTLIVLNGAKQCSEFKKYLIATVEKEYYMKPLRVYPHQVHYYGDDGEIHVYIINGNSRTHSISMKADLVYLDSTIKPSKLKFLKEITYSLLQPEGIFIIEDFISNNLLDDVYNP